MKARSQLFTKIAIPAVLALVVLLSCSRPSGNQTIRIIRFEKILSATEPAALPGVIRQDHPAMVPLFRVFNEELIRIGPDTASTYPLNLNMFLSDTMIRSVYREAGSLEPEFTAELERAREGFAKIERMAGIRGPEQLVTFLSGFNQTFVTLPGILGIGLDSYLGATNPSYASLGIPVYLRAGMNPANLTGDAVRAWLYSELPEPEGGFLDRMIYEGKIHYLAAKALPRTSEEDLFHYSRQQLKWCRDREGAMWKFLAEQKILFSDDRMVIRKFMDEAPYTKDFGDDSPGRTGIWIGYRLVESYVRATGCTPAALASNTGYREILAASNYHP